MVSINLRTSIASVGPLIPFIREDLGLSNGLAGFLTTLPLLTFATFSLFAPGIGKRLGMGRAVFLGVAILTAGVILRVLGGIELMLFGTALTGIGIVIANVLLIPLIKVRLPEKLGLMTALLATMMSLFAAIAVGMSVPIAVDWDFGWRGSLAFWAVFMVLAMILWIPQLQRPKASLTEVTDPAKNVWKSKLAWQITIFMGCQSELVTYASLGIVGICMGSSLSIAYTLIALRTAEDQTTAKLSAMVQSSGYYLAALGPFLFGVSLDLFDNWNVLIFFLLFFAMAFTIFGMSAGRDRKI